MIAVILGRDPKLGAAYWALTRCMQAEQMLRRGARAGDVRELVDEAANLWWAADGAVRS